MGKWKKKRLADLAEIVGGGTPKTKIGEYWEGNITWLSPTDLPEIGEIAFISNSKRTISEEGLNNSSAKLLPKGAVIYSTRATIGKLGIAKTSLATNQGFTNFICCNNLDNKFLCYALINYRKEIESLSNSTTFSEVSKSSIRDFSIPIPNLKEQKFIVSKLDALFERIDQAIALVEENIQATEELMGSVLNEEFKKLDVSTEPLSEIVNITGGGTPSKKNSSYYGGKIPWATVGDMNVDKLSETALYITKKGLENSSTNIIPKGNVIIATRVGLGKVCLLDVDTAINQDLKGIIPKDDKILPVFLFWLFKSIAEFIEENGTGATVKGVKLTFINSLQIPTPSIKKQQELVDRLKAISDYSRDLIIQQKKKIESLKSLKSSLLDQAFKGELVKEESEPAKIHQLHSSKMFEVEGLSKIDVQAIVMAMTILAHENHPNYKPTLGHVKMEKTLNTVESHIGLDMGRKPKRLAAGPADMNRLMKVEHKARNQGWFDAIQREDGSWYYTLGTRSEPLFRKAFTYLKKHKIEIDRIIDLFLPYKTDDVGVFATAYSAWHDLIAKGENPAEELIVEHAGTKKHWHVNKEKIPKEKLYEAIAWLEANNLVPDGRGKLTLKAKSTG